MRSLRATAVASALGAILALLIACGPESSSPSQAPATGLDSGIQGVVLLGPTCANQPIYASPCVTPYAAQLVIVDGNGVTVTRITSGADGHFQVSLPPGNYVIQPTPGVDGVPSGTPLEVNVVAGDYAVVEVDYDTGLR